MNNKIYTTLAAMYNEINEVKGDTHTLVEAIQKRISNQEEVLIARKGYLTINDRFDDIEGKTSLAMMDVNELRVEMSNLKDSMPEYLEPPIPMFGVNDKDVIVAINNKVSYQEQLLNLPPQDQQVVYNPNKNFVIDAYYRSASDNIITKKVEYTSDLDVSYDKEVSTLVNKVLLAKPVGSDYRVPLYTANIFYLENADACVIPALGTVVTDYKTNSGNEGHNKHVVRCFRDDEGFWEVKRSFASITMNFNKPIPLSKVLWEMETNSTISQISIDYSDDLDNWNDIYFGGIRSHTHELPSEVLVKNLRITFNVFDNTAKNFEIKVKKIKLYATEYKAKSGIVSTVKPIPVVDSESLKIINSSPTIDDPFFTTKFAITNREDHQGVWYTYIPKVYSVMPGDFYDMYDRKYTESVLRNNLKVQVYSRSIFTTHIFYSTYSASVIGAIGTPAITGRVTESFPDSWKPFSRCAIRINIKTKGQSYTIPLNSANLNKVHTAQIGPRTIEYRISALDNRTIKVHFFGGDSGLTIDHAEVEFLRARSVEETYGNGSTYRYSPSVSSSASITKDTVYVNGCAVDGVESYVNYSVRYLYYYSYSWTTSWWRSSSGDYNASLNGVEYGSAVILDSGFKSNTSEAVGSRVNTGKYIKTNCDLPLAIYISSNRLSQLLTAVQNDIISAEGIGNGQQPVYEYNKDYVAKVFTGGKGKIVKIAPIQSTANLENIQYSVSFDGYNYMIFDPDTSKWSPNFTKGMNAEILQTINDSWFGQVQYGEWLYIKVSLKSPESEVHQVTVEFSNDEFVSIHQDDILDKGMHHRHLENIHRETLERFIQADCPILLLASETKSTSPMYKYALSGYDLVDFNSVQWRKLNDSLVETCFLPNDNVLYRNVTNNHYYVRVVKRIIDNQTAVIDARDDIKESLADVTERQFQVEQQVLSSIDVLSQNVRLLHEGMLNGSVPEALPEYTLPSVRHIDIPELQAGEMYRISEVPSLRGIQVWERKDSFKQYSHKMFFTKEHEDKYSAFGVMVKEHGAEIRDEYDTTNPYLMPKDVNSHIGEWGKVVTPMFDLTCSYGGAGTYTLLRNILNNSLPSYSWYWNPSYGMYYSASWDLPGEDVRWVDIIFDFRQVRYLNYINNLMFAYDSNLGGNLTYQQTHFACSIDGKEYTTITSFTGYSNGSAVHFNREVRYIRIRLEVPYSYNRGKGWVQFNRLELYWAPVRYDFGKEFHIYNSAPVDTSNWLSFDKILVDRFIDHNPAEMRFILSDHPDRMNWKYWNGSSWITATHIRFSNSMTVQQILSLGPTQLNQLTKGQLYFCAIMKTDDRHKTPVLRNVEFLHDLDTRPYYDMIDVNSIEFNYYPMEQEMAITNKSSTSKKLRLALL